MHHLDKSSHHLFTGAHVGDYAVAQGSDGFYVGVCLLIHHLGLLAYCYHALCPAVEGHHTGLVHHYLSVAYDDGINTNKKDIYLDAIKKSKTNPKDIIAFDDSYGSCQSAIDAGIENIVRINHYNYRHLDSPAIKQEIYDFTELDYQILKK